METESLERLIREHSFLQGLGDAHIATLTGCASNMRVAPGEFLLREGEPAEQLYLIRAGQVAIEVHLPGKGTVQVGTVGEDQVLGWSWLVPPFQWHFDARAIELTRALALDAKCLRDKFDVDHELGYEVLRRFIGLIAQRLEWTRMQLLDLYKDA